MDKGTVVFISCSFRRGGFPSERVFIIRSNGPGEFRGVADAQYCYRADKRPLGEEPGEGGEIAGNLLGVVVRASDDTTVRVHLPDGEVYELDRADVIPAREVKSDHVLVES